MTQFKPPKNSQILETRCAESALFLKSLPTNEDSRWWEDRNSNGP